jgi:hypothetical protein
MWAFNVARSLLREAGLAVLPHPIPTTDEQTVNLAREALKDTSPNNVWCLKVHSILQNPSPVNGFITTVRDPRDALVSFMRFTRCDFEYALWSAGIWTKVCDYYRDLPREFSLCLDFEAIITEPMNVAGSINTFLGLGLSTPNIADAVAEFRREKVRQRVNAIQQDFERRRETGDGDVADMLVPNMDGTTRVRDPATGFQSGHVADYYNPGDWRVLLTADQKKRLDQTIGDWLTRHGYDVSHCQRCDETGWLCEKHPDRPWGGVSQRADACACGAGIPCPELQHHRAVRRPVG